MPHKTTRLQLWADFIETVGHFGRKAYTDSGVNSVEFGSLIRAMGSDEILLHTGPTLKELRHDLHARFSHNHSNPFPTGDEVTDVYRRQDLAMFAAFSYQLTFQAGEIQEWCEIALNLHMDDADLFGFMLSAKFGIADPGEDAPYELVRQKFDAWVRHNEPGG